MMRSGRIHNTEATGEGRLRYNTSTLWQLWIIFSFVGKGMFWFLRFHGVAGYLNTLGRYEGWSGGLRRQARLVGS